MSSINREFTQRRRRQLRKRYLKSEFALPQTLSRLFQLVQFVKCWQMFLEQNSEDCFKVQEKKKKVVVLCSRPRQNVKSGTFSLCCRATTAKKYVCTKKRDARAKLLFCQLNSINFLLFSLPSPSSLLKLPIFVFENLRFGPSTRKRKAGVFKNLYSLERF